MSRDETGDWKVARTCRLESLRYKCEDRLYSEMVTQIFPTHLSSARVLLRRLQRGDAEALSRYRSLPEVVRFQSWETFGVEEANRLIADQSKQEPGVPGSWLQLAIIERVSGVLVGDCGLHFHPDEPAQVELGITLAPNHQKRGYATEALMCVLEFVFGALGKHRVFAVTAAENTAAAALFRRLGFRQEAHFIEHRWHRGFWESELMFAILRREWESNRASRMMRDGPVDLR